jgi:CubicO group peptidase (beta-lactamase class C family)
VRKEFRIWSVAALACVGCCLTPAAGAGAAARTGEPASTSRGPGLVETSDGCVKPGVAQRQVESLVKAAMPELGLRATIVRVETGEEALVNAGFGNSMKGVRASPRMYFRIGSMAIPYLINLVLQLEDEGKLSLDDKLARYRPNFPEADEVTLRMLANSTSGYPDWIQGNEPFQKVLLENPFRQWTANELLHWSFTLPLVCPPGTCFHYAHTNFAILSQVIAKVSGKSVSKLMHERFLGPLGLDHTQISRFPAFAGPALHSYTGERGVYEDATFWTPSWTIGDGDVMASTLADAVKATREIGRGKLISARANKERIAPTLADMKPFSPHLYYGLGAQVADGWQFQNPFLNGYTGAVGYLPAQDLSVGIVTTQLPQSANSSTNFATVLLARLSEYLSPQHAIRLPPS